MVATALTLAAAVRGSSAAADMPIGKPRLAPSPQSTTPTIARGTLGTKMSMPRPTTATAALVRSTGTRPNRSISGLPATRPDGHRGEEHGQDRRAARVVQAVAVDHRQGQPVVRRALGQGHAEHDHADEQGRRLLPDGPARDGELHGAGVRRLGLGDALVSEPAHGGAERHAGDDADDDEVQRDRDLEPLGERAEAGAGERAEAERGVEERHDRAAAESFGRGAGDVHRHVAQPVAEAERDQADPDRGEAPPGAHGDAGHHQTECQADGGDLHAATWRRAVRRCARRR